MLITSEKIGPGWFLLLDMHGIAAWESKPPATKAPFEIFETGGVPTLLSWATCEVEIYGSFLGITCDTRVNGKPLRLRKATFSYSMYDEVTTNIEIQTFIKSGDIITFGVPVRHMTVNIIQDPIVRQDLFGSVLGVIG